LASTRLCRGERAMTGDWWFGLIAGFGVCLILWWVVDRHSPALAQPSPEAPRTARQK
jgi:hypothetical protein